MTIDNRNRALPRSSSITRLSPQTSWLDFIDTSADLTLVSDDEREVEALQEENDETKTTN